jgi:hypothetical protein
MKIQLASDKMNKSGLQMAEIKMRQFVEAAKAQNWSECLDCAEFTLNLCDTEYEQNKVFMGFLQMAFMAGELEGIRELKL